MLRLGPSHVNRRRIECILNVGSIEFFDHFHAGPAIFSDLIDVGSFHQAHTNIGMSQAIGRPSVSRTVKLQIQLVQYPVEQLSLDFSENQARGLPHRCGPSGA